MCILIFVVEVDRIIIAYIKLGTWLRGTVQMVVLI